MYTIKKAIRQVKVYVGAELGLDSEKDAFVELKEIPTLSYMELAKLRSKFGGTSEEESVDLQVTLFTFFYEHFNEIFLDSNIMVDDKTPATSEQVREVIFSSLRLTTKIIGEYANSGLLNA